MTLPLDIIKVIVLFGLLAMTSLCGMLPLLLVRLLGAEPENTPQTSDSQSRPTSSRRRLSSYSWLLSYLSCFSAGVFLATCLLDLLPGVRRTLIKSLYSNEIYTGFPVAEFVMVIGLFLILIIEQIVLTARENSLSVSDTSEDSNVRQPLLQSAVNEQKDITESLRSENSLGGLSDEPHRRTAFSDEDRNLSQNLSDQQPGPLRRVSRSESVSSNHAHGHHGYGTHSPLRAMLLVFALALHSIFEGLTIGLQTTVEDVLGIFAALLLHKSILSFSLGMNLIRSRISRKSALKSIILFSLSSPVGIAMGIGIDQMWNSVSSGILHGLLQGIASGTFLYIIFFEILPKEFNNASERLLKVLFLIIGYATVTGILFLSDETKHPFCILGEAKPV